MTSLLDAPWIREAEMYGMPNYVVPMEEIHDDIKDATDSLNKAIDYLDKAREKVGCYADEDRIKSLISDIDNLIESIWDAYEEIDDDP